MDTFVNKQIKLNGSIIKESRKRLRYTQEQLCEAINISRSQLQRIESGSALNVNFTTVCNLCSFLGLNFEDIISDLSKGGF